MGLMHLWLAMLCVSSCSLATVSEDLVVLVKPINSVPQGSAVTLPCWLNPPQSAEALEVRWYRGSENFDTPILHYLERKFVKASQNASYVGRVSFGMKDATSGGLKMGDVSLKLLDVTLSDAGTYFCFVSSDEVHDSASVNLLVTATGSNPLLSVVWKENNMVNVSCHSESWFPEPVMQWSDQKGNLTPVNMVYLKDARGLHAVHSWVFVPSNSQVSCLVGLKNEEAKEGKFYLGNPEKQEKTGYGWVAFGLLCGVLAIVLAVFGVLYIRKREKSKPRHEEELLLPKVAFTTVQRYDHSAFHKIYANITPDKRENKYVTVRDTKIRDSSSVTVSDGQVTRLTAIQGTPGFSSGQHYWEVSLQISANVPPKQSWWVGVTSASEIPHDTKFPPNTSDGFWYLSSSKDDFFQVNTEPRLSLPVSVRPSKVGVYLNCDTGELAFYNVDHGSLISSLTGIFSGEVFPIFNPGLGDISPMKILHRDEQTQGYDDTVILEEAKEE